MSNNWDTVIPQDQLSALELDDPWRDKTVRKSSSSSSVGLKKSGSRPISKSQTINSIQNVFTDSQKIAYVSLVYLLISTKQKQLPLTKAQQSYQEWSQRFMEKLYVYLDILPQERTMVETMAEHGLLTQDLVKGIMRDVEEQVDHLKNKDVDQTPTDVRYTILSHLYILGISDGHFDARARGLLKALSLEMHVPVDDLVKMENVIAEELRLYDYAEKVKHEGEVVVQRNKLEGKNRWLFAGLATVAGGAVIGLTAGLAAPLIAGGIMSALTTVGVTGAGVAGVTTFMTSAGGLAVITTGGVLTGGGMSGVKMMKRTKGIEEFEFLGLQDALEMIKQNKEKRKLEREAKQKKPHAVLQVEEQKRQEDAIKATNELHRSSSGKEDTLAPQQVLWDMTSEGDDSHVNEQATEQVIDKIAGLGSSNISLEPHDVAFDDDLDGMKGPEEPEPTPRQTNVLITVAGWVSDDKDDHTYPFSVLEPGLNGDQYTLIWETQILKDLGSMISILVSEVASFIFQQGLGATVLLGPLMLALTAPMWAIKLTYLVDNPWGNALTKAEKAGRLLADTLIGQVQGNRPVTLVGFSLGSRLIYYCLLELAAKNAYGIVEDVVIFGTPVITTTKELDQIRSVVAGRIVNGYSSTDQLLGVLYRASSALWSHVPGLNPILTHNVENIDLTDIMKGHMDYLSQLPKALKRAGFTINAEEFEDQQAEQEKFDQENKLQSKKSTEQLSEKADEKLKDKRRSSAKKAGGEQVLDPVQDELHEMAKLESMMQEYWEPREIPSTLPTLVLDAPKELESTMPPLVIKKE
ncbi:hypothetical protein EDD86DRAFT_208654 [Gorgonomyces haynaldii]|nr:hypothetical protein EDD86DRAFT_208654 [Gorgonomyces haynaldii]